MGGDRIEVEPELELTAPLAIRGATRAPPFRPTGHPGCRHVAALGDGPKGLCALFGGLAGHRRQALDQRPELVLAEQSHDGVTVVISEASRLEVDGDRQVADDRREFATHVDLLAMVAQLVAQLLGRHVVEPREQRVEVAEFADQLGGGLLADTGNARDVVSRVAL